MKPIVMVDMDGTLADVNHRLHYIRGAGRPDWKRFFEAQRHDRPNEAIVDQVRQWAKSHEIVIVTGRPDKYRHETAEWLRKYNIPYWRAYSCVRQAITVRITW